MKELFEKWWWGSGAGDSKATEFASGALPVKELAAAAFNDGAELMLARVVVMLRAEANKADKEGKSVSKQALLYAATKVAEIQ